ncbi:unnamed protein product [Prorocentrum cordatum]|uniref:Rieske domain-containing protein n=1 Tax=Prorocentrum cordatum TaxID=2364126 RepID=A0ABN9UQB9_9DINO|nr:unnamed protein product [Polarella glacialis]
MWTCLRHVDAPVETRTGRRQNQKQCWPRTSDKNFKTVSVNAWVEESEGEPGLVLGLRGEPYWLLPGKSGGIRNFALRAECTHLGCIAPWNEAGPPRGRRCSLRVGSSDVVVLISPGGFPPMLAPRKPSELLGDFELFPGLRPPGC